MSIFAPRMDVRGLLRFSLPLNLDRLRWFQRVLDREMREKLFGAALSSFRIQSVNCGTEQKVDEGHESYGELVLHRSVTFQLFRRFLGIRALVAHSSRGVRGLACAPIPEGSSRRMRGGFADALLRCARGGGGSAWMIWSEVPGVLGGSRAFQ